MKDYEISKAHHEDRNFSLWEYNVSHSSLLIRSPKGPGNSTNIDLECYDVQYLALPKNLKGLELVEPTHEELIQIEGLLGEQKLRHCIVRIIASEGRRFPIVAGNFRFTENPWSYTESPFKVSNLRRAT